MLNLEEIIILTVVRRNSYMSKFMLAEVAAAEAQMDPRVVRVGIDRMVSHRFLAPSSEIQGTLEITRHGERVLLDSAARVRGLVNSIM